MGKLSRTKGKVGEREAVKMLRTLYGIEARRTAQRCGRDGMPDIESIPGIHLEVKRRAAIAAEEFLEQARRDAKASEAPVVFMRADRSRRWMVLVDLRDARVAAELFLAALACPPKAE